MIKNKNKNKNEKYVGLGTSLENSFVLYNRSGGSRGGGGGPGCLDPPLEPQYEYN